MSTQSILLTATTVSTSYHGTPLFFNNSMVPCCHQMKCTLVSLTIALLCRPVSPHFLILHLASIKLLRISHQYHTSLPLYMLSCCALCLDCPFQYDKILSSDKSTLVVSSSLVILCLLYLVWTVIVLVTIGL